MSEQPPVEDMSRATQTILIMGTIAVVAFIGLGFYLSGPDSKYPECDRGFFGWPTTEFQRCEVDATVRRLRGY